MVYIFNQGASVNRRMNSAMMYEYLKKNTHDFSVPGETGIKQHIGALFQNINNKENIIISI